jgi:hypothetical protein
VIDWWRRRHLVGDALLYGGLGLILASGGWNLSAAFAPPGRLSHGPPVTRTLTRTHTISRTVRVRAVVLRREDHTVTVYVPRTVLHAGKRLFVVHGVFRLRTGLGTGLTLSAVAVLPGEPVTVTVPVTVTEPGSSGTVTLPADTVTLPASTVTVPTTITVTLPVPDGTGTP